MIETFIGIGLSQYLKARLGKRYPQHFEYREAMKVSPKIAWWQAILIILGLLGVAGATVLLVLNGR
jgi:hypothetical protein